jgi:BlaI family penicillinase repressor
MDYECNNLNFITIVVLKGTTMKNLPKISESEWLVMRALWAKNPLGANEIYEQLAGRRKWKFKTVKTLIDRLTQKGAVRFEKEGRKHKYYPSVAEKDCVATETRSFVRRVYGGVAKPMLAAFLEDAELSAEDIAELREILEQKAEE